MINISTSEQVKPILSNYFVFKFGHSGIIIDKRIPLSLLFVDCQCFKAKMILLGKLSTSAVHMCSNYDSGAPLHQMCSPMLDMVQMVCMTCAVEGGANASHSCVNITFPFFFTLGYLSQRGGFERERNRQKFIFLLCAFVRYARLQ